MPIPRLTRMVVVGLVLISAIIWVSLTELRPERVTLLVTAVIGAVTAVYALLTYEIMLQNQTMAQAALESARLTERSLRFSHSGNLIFATVSTRNVRLGDSRSGIVPIENKDYSKALEIAAEGGDQTEFVFAIVENKGRGPATNVNVEAEYTILDSTNPNGESVLTKRTIVPVIEPNCGIAICVFIAKTPTPNDSVRLICARLSASDFYREAIHEPAQNTEVRSNLHHTEQAKGCAITLG